MNLTDWESLTLEEFGKVLDRWAANRDSKYKEGWEHTRLLASTMLAPYLPKGKDPDPRKLFPMPWDKKETNTPRKQATATESKDKAKRLAKSAGAQIYKAKQLTNN